MDSAECGLAFEVDGFVTAAQEQEPDTEESA